MSGSQKSLEHIYKQLLEQSIIEDIAAEQGINLRLATEIYYKSKLAKQVSAGEYGIQYLSHYVLAHDLIENEPELFLA